MRKVDRDEIIDEILNCEDCEGGERGVFVCNEHEEKFQEQVEYISTDSDTKGAKDER